MYKVRVQLEPCQYRRVLLLEAAYDLLTVPYGVAVERLYLGDVVLAVEGNLVDVDRILVQKILEDVLFLPCVVKVVCRIRYVCLWDLTYHEPRAIWVLRDRYSGPFYCTSGSGDTFLGLEVQYHAFLNTPQSRGISESHHSLYTVRAAFIPFHPLALFSRHCWLRHPSRGTRLYSRHISAMLA